MSLAEAFRLTLHLVIFSVDGVYSFQCIPCFRLTVPLLVSSWIVVRELWSILQNKVISSGKTSSVARFMRAVVSSLCFHVLWEKAWVSYVFVVCSGVALLFRMSIVQRWNGIDMSVQHFGKLQLCSFRVVKLHWMVDPKTTNVVMRQKKRGCLCVVLTFCVC